MKSTRETRAGKINGRNQFNKVSCGTKKSQEGARHSTMKHAYWRSDDEVMSSVQLVLSCKVEGSHIPPFKHRLIKVTFVL